MGAPFRYSSADQRSYFGWVVQELMSKSLGTELSGKLLNKPNKA